MKTYEGVSKSFRTGRLVRELQMVQLSATRCSYVAILWVSLVRFCRHNPLCCFSTSVYYCCCCCLFRYLLSPENFGYTLVWGNSVTLYFTSALVGGEWSASRPGRFTSGRVLGIHWIWGWVCTRAGLDVVSKRKIHSPCLESNPDHTIVQPVASRYTNWATPLC
jgi:hypothetical protein